MLAISYALSTIATVLGLIEPFGKKMRTILAFNFTGNLLVGLSYLLTDAKTGAVVCFVACVQVVINYFFDMKGKKVPVWLIAIYLVVFVSVNLLAFENWYDAFSLVASMLFVISVAQSNAKYYRILYFSNSAVWILYDFLSGATGNLSTHIVLVIATLISMIVRNKEKTS